MTTSTPVSLNFSSEVQAAKAAGAPIVALESTIITHGMPWPQNAQMVDQVQASVRAAGAVPATIAVLEGQVHIGLEPAQVEDLAKAKNVRKVSRADLAFCIAQKDTGATTVAGTMILANLAQIPTFATGGIGGVHRGAQDTFDISADLRELAQTPVTVVAAGAKAILDIPKTLEVLETYGVPVMAFGQDDFPAFWSRSSGLAAPLRVDNVRQIAQSAVTRAALGLPGGQLVGNPIPREAEIPLSELTPVIDHALKDAVDQNILGKAVTPFLLGRIFELTEGRSLEANIALVLSNVRLAAEIAVCRAKL